MLGWQRLVAGCYIIEPCSVIGFSVYSRMRRDEVISLSGPDEFGEFYRRLKSLKEFHRRNPNEVEEPMAMEFLRLDKQRTHPPEHMQALVDFTDEEGYGKYLDMHALHDTFINLRHMEVRGDAADAPCTK